MSYILEALKKVEQKQQREGIPRLLTLPPDVPEEGAKSRALLYVILCVLVLNAAVMVAWWIAPQQRHTTTVPIVEPLPVREKTSSITSEKAASTLDTPVPGKSLSGQTIPEISEKPAPSSNPAPPVNREGAPTHKEKTVASITNYLPESQARKKGEHPPAASGARLFDLEELPPAVRGNLPDFKISGHAYSPEPRFRVARVNDKIVQEGEALGYGVKVHEITPGGVILTYQGYRFKVGIQDNR